MRKNKLFVHKQPLTTTRKRSFLSLFLWSAVGLIVLVVFASFATHQKTTDRETRKPVAEKGILLKEIPRPDHPPREEFGGAPGMEKEQMSGREGTGPATVTAVPDFKSFPDARKGEGAGGAEQVASSTDEFKMAAESAPPPPTSVPASDKAPADKTPGATEKPDAATPSDQNSSPKRTQVPAMSKPGVEGPVTAAVKQKSGIPSVGSSASPKPPSASAALTPPKATSAPGKSASQPQSKLMYVVQVGSFKDKQNAEDLKQSLVKRGYDVVIKMHTHPKLGQLYVVQLEPVPEEGRASTLITQIGQEEKVKPVMLKVHSE